MIEKAINKILEIGKTSILEINGRNYTDKNVIPVKEPTPKTLVVHTLSSLVDYLKKGIDSLKKDSLVIHIVSPTEVNLLGFLKDDSFFERPEFVSAIFDPPQIRTGDYSSIESFIIGLQAYFVPTESTAKLLKVVGNVKGEQVQQFSDDGYTQAVTAKAGIATVENVVVPNPVKLKPFRTFPEIEQPESLFVFRMRQQPGSTPSCGLWEADNKLWKVEGINSIAVWLKDKIQDVPIIA